MRRRKWAFDFKSQITLQLQVFFALFLSFGFRLFALFWLKRFLFCCYALACGLLALFWHVGFLLCCYALACTVVGFLLCSYCGLFALYAVASGFLLKLF